MTFPAWLLLMLPWAAASGSEPAVILRQCNASASLIYAGEALVAVRLGMAL